MKLLIFDLDGTLIDSLSDLTAAVNLLRYSRGMTNLSRSDVRSLVGQGARRLVERALPRLSPEETDRALADFLAYNRKHIADRTVLYPGVRETLAALEGLGFKLAIVSNKNEDLCCRVLDALTIRDFFCGLLGADSLPERKPHPAPLLKLMEFFAVSPGETVMIGDSINDIDAGRGAGVTTVGCSWGYGQPGELTNADYRISSFPEILTLPFLAR